MNQSIVWKSDCAIRLLFWCKKSLTNSVGQKCMQFGFKSMWRSLEAVQAKAPVHKLFAHGGASMLLGPVTGRTDTYLDRSVPLKGGLARSCTYGKLLIDQGGHVSLPHREEFGVIKRNGAQSISLHCLRLSRIEGMAEARSEGRSLAPKFMALLSILYPSSFSFHYSTSTNPLYL